MKKHRLSETTVFALRFLLRICCHLEMKVSISLLSAIYLYIVCFLIVQSCTVLSINASARPLCVKVVPGRTIDFGLCVIGETIAKDIEVW